MIPQFAWYDYGDQWNFVSILRYPDFQATTHYIQNVLFNVIRSEVDDAKNASLQNDIIQSYGLFIICIVRNEDSQLT